MGNRYDYVKYDDQANGLQADFKNTFMKLEETIDTQIQSPRAKALVHTKLEEAYMWIGKGIRDDQMERNKNTELNETREPVIIEPPQAEGEKNDSAK